MFSYFLFERDYGTRIAFQATRGTRQVYKKICKEKKENKLQGLHSLREVKQHRSPISHKGLFSKVLTFTFSCKSVNLVDAKNLYTSLFSAALPVDCIYGGIYGVHITI